MIQVRTAAVAGLSIAAAAVLGLVAGPAQASSATRVEHWGSYFGDDNKAHTDTLLAPRAIRLPGTVVQVATSNSSEYALLTNGTVFAWGQGTHGELGDGATANSFNTPVQVKFPAGVVIASLPTDAMPFDTGLALDTAGRAWGWGYNSVGQLCNGAAKEQDTPIRVPLAHVTQLTGAGGHALYLAAGTVYACGGNSTGALGDGNTTLSMTPVKVSGLSGKSVVTLVSAYQNGGALLTNGDYYDWGLNAGGQLGDGTTTNSTVPVLVTLTERVVQVVQGGSIGDNGQTLVELSDGSLRGWGTDGCGQLLDNGTKNKTTPVTATPPAGVTFTTLATGGENSYGITATGDVYAWGCGGVGQLGNGEKGNSRTAILVEHGMSLISSTAENVATAP